MDVVDPTDPASPTAVSARTALQAPAGPHPGGRRPGLALGGPHRSGTNDAGLGLGRPIGTAARIAVVPARVHPTLGALPRIVGPAGSRALPTWGLGFGL